MPKLEMRRVGRWHLFSRERPTSPLSARTVLTSIRDPEGAMRQWSNLFRARAEASNLVRPNRDVPRARERAAALSFEAGDQKIPPPKRHNTAEWMNLLKSLGVLRWNQWRADNPKEIPDLSGVDFSDEALWNGSTIWRQDPLNPKHRPSALLHEDDPDDPHRQVGIDLSGANLDRAVFSGVSLRFANLDGARMRAANLTMADLTGADLTRADLFEANLEKANFAFAVLDHTWLDRAKNVATARFEQTSCPHAWFSTTGERTDLEGIDFSGCDLSFARLERVDFAGAKLNQTVLKGANLQAAHFAARGGRTPASLCEADLREANLDSASIRGCDLRESRWDGAKTTDIKYGSLRGKCLGAGGVNDVYGSSKFRKALREHEFIDSMKNGVMDGPFIRPIVALVRSALLGLICYAAVKTAMPQGGEDVLTGAAVAGALGGLLSATKPGATLLMSIWRTFNYGRSITPVAVFAVAWIAIIGGVYDARRNIDFVVALPDETCRTLGGGAENCTTLGEQYDITKHPSYPWFVAVMGFCTLSITDLIFPKTGFGQVVIAANVLLGFLTLGLLLAVLADKFARRN